MPTLQVNFANPERDKETIAARILADTASQVTLIEASLVKKLHLRKSPSRLNLITLGGRDSTTAESTIVELRSRCTKYRVLVKAHIVDKITNPLITYKGNPLRDYPQLAGEAQPLAETWPITGLCKIHCLVGQDHLSAILKGRITQLDTDGRGLSAVSSPFGVVLMGFQKDVDPAAGRLVLATSAKSTILEVPKSMQVQENKSLKQLQELHSAFEKFLSLERIGLDDEQDKIELTGEQHDAIRHFENTVEYNADGRYFTVQLPFDETRPRLRNNYYVALAQMRSLLRSFERNPDKKKTYSDTMNNYFAQDMAEYVTGDPRADDFTYYIPHSCVKKKSADGSTIKYRVVFNASSVEPRSGQSLNTRGISGPVPDASLMRILLQFRSFPIIWGVDVSSFFPSIHLHSSQHHLQNFLWLDAEGRIQPAKMKRLIFGAKASASLASLVVFRLLDMHAESDPDLVRTVKRSIYCDDINLGAPSVDSAKTDLARIREIFAKGGFSLAKYYANDDDILSGVPDDQRTFPSGQQAAPIKILGCVYDIPREMIRINTEFFHIFGKTHKRMTKRILSSMVSSLYDVIGLTTPWKLSGQIIIRDVWAWNELLALETGCPKNSLKFWDLIMTADLEARVAKWREDFELMEKIEAERYNLLLLEGARRKITTFADASLDAMGVVVYMVTDSGDGSDRLIHFLGSKSQVRKKNGPSLARCECTSAKIASTYVANIKEGMETPDIETEYYTDSMDTWWWIKSKSTTVWKVYIHNCLKTIYQHTSVDQWYYVPTDLNPADLATRFTTARDFYERKDFWLKGPDFLRSGDRPKQPGDGDGMPAAAAGELLGKKPTVLVTVIASDPIRRLLLAKESFLFTLRTVMRLRRRLPSYKRSKTYAIGFSREEMNDAIEAIAMLAQRESYHEEMKQLAKGEPVSASSLTPLQPYLDAHGKLRYGGRSNRAKEDYGESFTAPMILPERHTVVERLLRYVHLSCAHLNSKTMIPLLRQRFWIVHARRAVERTRKNCKECQARFAHALDPSFAPLPPERLDRNVPPFYNVEMDAMGPVFTSSDNGQTKSRRWILVLACAFTRAVNAEVLPDLTANGFVVAFRKHAGAHGFPGGECRLDNFPSHSSMADLLRMLDGRFLRSQIRENYALDKDLTGLKFSWSPSYSPSCNGAIEAVLGVYKRALKSAIGNRWVSPDELEMLVRESKLIVNSRPLAANPSSDPDADEILTANHLLHGHALNPTPFGSAMITDKRHKSAREYWTTRQATTEKFQQLFIAQYVAELTERRRHISYATDVRPKDLVLVKYPPSRMKRCEWPTAIVDSVKPSPDGVVRSVVIRTAKGTEVKSVRSLIFLRHLDEFETDDDPVDGADPTVNKPSKSRDPPRDKHSLKFKKHSFPSHESETDSAEANLESAIDLADQDYNEQGEEI